MEWWICEWGQLDVWMRPIRSQLWDLWMRPIRSQLCTCHDSWAVATCADLWPNWILRIMITMRIFTSFPIMRKSCCKMGVWWHRTLNLSSDNTNPLLTHKPQPSDLHTLGRNRVYHVNKPLPPYFSPVKYHDDVIKWKHFPRYWPFVRGIHRSPVNSSHKGQWRGALMLLWSAPE